MDAEDRAKLTTRYPGNKKIGQVGKIYCPQHSLKDMKKLHLLGRGHIGHWKAARLTL